MYNHVAYNLLWDCDNRLKTFTKPLFYGKIKVSIVQISYMGYFKFYYSLLDLKKVVTFAYFNVSKDIEFEFFNY
jgi:hypothetical protein